MTIKKFEDAGLAQETFGPVLWVMAVEDVDEGVTYLRESGEKPLAVYLYSKNRENQDWVRGNCSSGALQINGVFTYMGQHHFGFGGVGTSGMGTYHGDRTFFTFCHMKSVSRGLFDFPCSAARLTYVPRGGWRLKAAKMFLPLNRWLGS